MTNKERLENNNSRIQENTNRLAGIKTKLENLNVEMTDLVVTPKSTSQRIEGRYKTVTVSGDNDLIASNIKAGVQIFDVIGTLSDESDLIESPYEPEGANRKPVWVKKSRNISNIQPFDVAGGTGQKFGKTFNGLTGATSYVLSFNKTRIPDITIANSALFGISYIFYYNGSTHVSTVKPEFTTRITADSTYRFNYTLNTPAECTHAVIYFDNNNGDTNTNINVHDIMLEYGTVAHDYEPYMSGVSVYVLDSVGKYQSANANYQLLPLSVKPTVETQIITGEFNEVTVAGDADLLAENIKAGVSIFDVEGSYSGVDTSDATAIASNIDKDIIAYGKNGERLVGTGQLLNTDAHPYMLPQIESYIGKSEVLPFGDDIYYLVNSNDVSGTGYVVTIRADQLPLDVTNKSLFIRYSPPASNPSGNMFLELFIADKGCRFSLKEGQDRVLGYDANGNRCNIDVYRIWESRGVLENVIPSKWEYKGNKSYYDTGDASGWFNYVSGDMYSISGLSVGPFYKGHGNEDCIVKTTFSSSAPHLKLEQGGVLYTRINNTQLADCLGITPDIVKAGETILGVNGIASSDNQEEYDTALALTNAIMTGSAPEIYTYLEYIKSDGNQYIDLGIKAETTRYGVEITAKFDNNNEGAFFGAWDTTGLLFGQSTYNGSGYAMAVDDVWKYPGIAYNTTVYHKFVYDPINGIYTIDDLPITITPSTGLDANMYLFSGNIYPTPIVGTSISECKIYDNGTLLYDLKPVIYNVTGEIGMYDAVSKIFMKNNGTGKFIAGPEIEVV